METTMASYAAVKHMHFTLIALSVGLYLVSFSGHLLESGLVQKKFMKITPHVVNTLLIVSGVFLCWMVQQYPGTDAWITEKLMAVVAYIVLAVLSIKSKRGKGVRFLICLGALAWVVLAAKMALLKQALLIL
jgi:uncharacterized membrane protein SirB2